MFLKNLYIEYKYGELNYRMLNISTLFFYS